MERSSPKQDERSHRTRRVVTASAFALLASGLAWMGWMANTPASADGTSNSGSLLGLWSSLLVLLAAAASWNAATLMTRLRMAAAVREVRAELHALTQLLDVWQWQTDPGHRLVRWQPPLGAPASAWAGRSAAQALWDRFDAAGTMRLHERMNAHTALTQLPVQQLNAPGTTSQWVLNGTPRFDAAGHFAGYFGTARCIDAELAQRDVRLNAKPTLNSTSDAADPTSTDSNPSDAEAFSYTVSHDLRAPVRVVEGFARILKEDYSAVLDRVGNDHLDRVLSAASRMNGMIDALLSLAQLSRQPLACQPVNLSQLAHYVVDDLRKTTPDRLVQVNIEPKLTVEGDPTLLRVVLENLLGNAWKYSGKAASASITFARTEHNGQAVFTVSDNGAGFDMRFADRLFGVFQRLHSASDFPGTGVGLASVKRIVQRHGGQIWAESEVGHGAQFHFTIESVRGSTASA